MKQPFFKLSLAVIAIVGLVTTIFLVQNRIENRSRAEKTVTLSFSPSSSDSIPLTVNPDDTFPVDIQLNPGTNLVSSTKIHIFYDPAKLEPYNGTPFEWNKDAFNQIVEGPVFTPGQISFTLSIGSDPSKAIKALTRVGTIRFHVLNYATSNEGPTLVTFGTDSQVSSISSNSSSTENVISSTIPATIMIGSSTTQIPDTNHSAISSITLPIPTIHCLLPNQLCTPSFVTSAQTDSILKVNYKVAGPNSFSSTSQSTPRNGGWGNDRGGKWNIGGGKCVWVPNPVVSQPTVTPQPSADSSCSSIRVHFYVDGVKKYTSGWLGWNGAPLPYNQLPLETGAVDLGPVSSGAHIVGVQAEGQGSGCNSGILKSWSGSLVVTTSTATLPPPPPPAACTNKAATDTMVVMDTSGSMNDKVGTSSQGTKLQNAKTAANSFVDILSADTRNKVGLVNFGTTAALGSTLTTDYTNVKNKISGLSATGWTCHECAIKRASQEITSQGRPGFKKVVVLLTDGQANYVDGTNKQVSASVAEQRALTAVTNEYNAHQTVFYTIGVGKDVNSNFLRQIATMTGGVYYFSPTASDLNNIYSQISLLLSKGSASGFVYEDENGNGSYDTNESKLSDWTLQLLSGNSVIQTAQTDESGNYNIGGLCDGAYTLKEVGKPSWTQTQPAGGIGYSINISNASNAIDKNFGNKSTARCSDNIDNDANGFTDQQDSTCHSDGNPNNPGTYLPQKDGENGTNTCSDSKDNNNNGLIDGADPVCHTGGNPNNPWDPNLPEINPTAFPTPIPTAVPTNVPTAVPTSAGPNMLLNVNLFLHGIGNSGDNTNPTTFNLSNQNPQHTNRTASVSIFDANNNPVTSAAGTVNFASGSYKGTVNLGSTLATGVYTIKIKTEQHLYRLVAGIQTLTAGQANTLPDTELVAGDTNDDNKLNILDYNSLINCYSDLSPAVACNPTLKLQTDLNDDGNVNQVDYNLFLREIATQPGQ